MKALVEFTGWFFLAYLVLLNGGYMALNLLAIPTLRRRLAREPLANMPAAYSGLEPPVSLLVPAYNEEATIASSVRSLLQLDYPDFEIVVVNDGSTDGTLAALGAAFDLEPYPESYWRQLEAKPVRGIYRSRTTAGLRVVDKENGGKADALNVGINASRHPYFCAMDADSILQRDSLRRVVEPFVDDPKTVASGGTVRIANGCTVSGGHLERVALPRNPLALFQIVEYLRAFLFGRLGWTTINAVLIISGAFGVFRKDVVVAAGGYRADTIGEDMELIVRLHRVLRERGEPYAIHFVPDPICWTEAPEDLAILRGQRIRWQRGLAESLHRNAGLLRTRGGGPAGLLAFPFFMLFECYGPLLEVAGYVLTVALWALGLVTGTQMLLFMLLAFSLGFLLSVSALLLEEVSYHLYPRGSQFALLVLVAIVENLGYRQLVTWWRLVGLTRWLRGAQVDLGHDDAEGLMAKVTRAWGPTLAIVVPGAAAAAIGGSSLVGWIIGHPPPFATIPGSTPVAAAAALGTLAAGVAVMASMSAARIASVLRHAASILLMLLGVLGLAQVFAGVNVGMDFPEMHSIADWQGAPVGRLAFPTSSALLLTGLLLACHDRVRNRAGALAMQIGAGLLLAMGISSLIAYDVRPENVFPLYRYSRMAPATAAAVVALGIGFLAIIVRAPWYERVYQRRADERILILAIGILTLVLVGVGAAALAVLQRHTEASVGAALNNAIDNRVTILESVFANRLTRASIVSARPTLQGLLVQWDRDGSPALRARLGEEATSYLDAGFRGLAFQDEHGRHLIEVGRLVGEPTIEVPVLGQRMEATLLWEDPEFVLRASAPVFREGVRVGTVVTEQVLELLPDLHFEVSHLGQTAEWVMCANGGASMACFPQRFVRYSRVLGRHHDARALPMDRALDGHRGVANTRDYLDEPVIAAYAPVGATGLGIVIKINTAEYYDPLVKQLLQWGQWFIAMAMIGALLLASQVRPVAQRLVQSEELARSRADALARSERDLGALYASLGDGVMVFTPEGIIEFANPAAEGIFGYAPAELTGKPVSVLVPDELRGANLRASGRFAATGESGLVGQKGMVRPALRRDGSKIQIEFSLSEMQQESGPRLVGVVRDVTAREALDRMKSEFVAAVSHELRTPLTSIIASLELAAEDGLAEPQRGMLEMARRNAGRLAKLVDDVIDSARLDSGSLRFAPTRFALAAAAAEAVALNEGYARSHGVTLRVEDESAGAEVHADRARVDQVFANLLSNAAKFSPAGAEVRVRLARRDGSVRAEVIDRGRGISDEFKPRVFQRFAQADASDARDKGGTGLGLSITKGLVEQMGGAIGFDSRAGAGTTFWFELPAAPAG